MPDCLSPVPSTVSPLPNDDIINTSWQMVVAEAARLNSGTLTTIDGDVCFENMESAREAVALTPADSAAGLAIKVRCVLDDLLVTVGGVEASDVLRAGGLPEPDSLEDMEHRHLCHLLIQLDAAAKAPPPDAELLAAWDEFILACNAYGDDDSPEQEDILGNAVTAAEDKIIALPATTPEGFAVKLRLLLCRSEYSGKEAEIMRGDLPEVGDTPTETSTIHLIEMLKTLPVPRSGAEAMAAAASCLARTIPMEV